jgi:hypothetical protein
LFSAMLRAEGIQSYPVLIDSARKLDVDVPSPAQFDHVITAARLGTGTGLTWLDTTPEVTPFGLILYQLRNKEAVVASEDSEGGLQRTPADSPIKTFMRFTLDGKFSEFGALDATLEAHGPGRSRLADARKLSAISAGAVEGVCKSSLRVGACRVTSMTFSSIPSRTRASLFI